VSGQIAGSVQCESLQRQFNEALRVGDSQTARTIAAQSHGCTWKGSAAELVRSFKSSEAKAFLNARGAWELTAPIQRRASVGGGPFCGPTYFEIAT
jgi:hypothetical protein